MYVQARWNDFDNGGRAASEFFVEATPFGSLETPLFYGLTDDDHYLQNLENYLGGEGCSAPGSDGLGMLIQLFIRS